MATTVTQPVVPPGPPSLPDRPLAASSAAAVLCRAETAECTCPDFCERDHDNE